MKIALDLQFICESLGALRITASPPSRPPVFACPREFIGSLDPSVRDDFNYSQNALQAGGVPIVPIDLSEVAEVASVFGRILPAELIEFIGRDLIKNEP